MTQPIGPTQPTIGRIVHVEFPPITVPAIVTAVTSGNGEIMCTAFPPGMPPKWLTAVPHDESGLHNVLTWHWPPVTR